MYFTLVVVFFSAFASISLAHPIEVEGFQPLPRWSPSDPIPGTGESKPVNERDETDEHVSVSPSLLSSWVNNGKQSSEEEDDSVFASMKGPSPLETVIEQALIPILSSERSEPHSQEETEDTVASRDMELQLLEQLDTTNLVARSKRNIFGDDDDEIRGKNYDFGPNEVTDGYGTPGVTYGYGPAEVTYGYGPAEVTYGYGPAEVTYGYGTRSKRQVFDADDDDDDDDNDDDDDDEIRAYGDNSYNGEVPEVPYAYGTRSKREVFSADDDDGGDSSEEGEEVPHAVLINDDEISAYRDNSFDGEDSKETDDLGTRSKLQIVDSETDDYGDDYEKENPGFPYVITPEDQFLSLLPEDAPLRKKRSLFYNVVVLDESERAEFEKPVPKGRKVKPIVEHTVVPLKTDNWRPQSVGPWVVYTPKKKQS